MELIQFYSSIFKDDDCIKYGHNEARPVLEQKKADNNEKWEENLLAKNAVEIDCQFRTAQITAAKLNTLSTILVLSYFDDSVLKFKLHFSGKLILLLLKPGESLVSSVVLTLPHKPDWRLRYQEDKDAHQDWDSEVDPGNQFPLNEGSKDIRKKNPSGDNNDTTSRQRTYEDSLGTIATAEDMLIPLSDGEVSSQTYTGWIVPSIPMPRPQRILKVEDSVVA